jgi:hypothetical protein
VAADDGSDPFGGEDPVAADTTTTTSPAPFDPGTPTTTVPAGDGGGDTTTTTAAVAVSSTTTVPGGPASLPTTATVQRLTWTGTMELSAVQEDGSIGTTTGTVVGFHVGPDRHRTEYVEESALTSAGGTLLGDRTMTWVVGAVNDRAWFEQDGEIEEMALDQAHRFIPYLSSALEGGVIPGDGVLADVAGRDGTDVEVLGRAGRRIIVAGADVETYAPLFLRYTPALYGTSGSGTVASVDLVIDLQTGGILEGSLTLDGVTAAGGDFELTVDFAVTAIDDRSIQVLIPG